MRKVFALVVAILMTAVTIGCESKPTSKPPAATPAGGGSTTGS